MKSAHAGMDITNAEFDALVGERGQSEMSSVLSPMGQDIVEGR
jgi:hypothetical protein